MQSIEWMNCEPVYIFKMLFEIDSIVSIDVIQIPTIQWNYINKWNDFFVSIESYLRASIEKNC